MKTNEKELKLYLSKAQFLMLLNNYQESDCKIQTNYYYDTSDFWLFKNGYTVRMRVSEDNLGKLQLKTKRTSNTNYFDRDEYELLKNQKDIPLTIKVDDPKYKFPNIDIFSKRLGDQILSLKGNLITVRHKIQIGQVMCDLDESYFVGNKDYELEVESSPKEIGLVKEKLKDLGLNENSKLGKFSRMMQALRKEKLI